MEKCSLPLTVALALAWTHPAWADGARAANQPLVILTEQGREDEEDAAFFSSVRALASEIGIAVSTHEVPTFEAVRDTLLSEAQQKTKLFLVAWILRGKGIREMYLFDPWKNQLRTRTVEAGTSATANAEILALILRAELLAYLSEPPPPPPAPSPQPLPPSPPPPARPDPRWALAVSYVVGTYLRDQGVQQGIGVALAHRWSRLYVGLHYAFLSAQDVSTADVTLTVQRSPFDLNVGYLWPDLHRLRFAAEAFVSGDSVSRHTSSAAAPWVAQPDGRRFVVGAGLRWRAEVRILHNLTLHLGLGTEAPLNPHDFQITRGPATTTVARLLPVCVGGEVGVNILAF